MSDPRIAALAEVDAMTGTGSRMFCGCGHPMHWHECGADAGSTSGPCRCRNDEARYTEPILSAALTPGPDYTDLLLLIADCLVTLAWQASRDGGARQARLEKIGAALAQPEDEGMSRYLVASVEGFLLGILLGILLGATLGSSHVYSPRSAWVEEPDGAQTGNNYTVTLATPYRAEWRVH